MDADFASVPSGGGERAYTRVDHGLVRVGNRWIERVWSGFSGCTTSLVQKQGEFEWAAAKNPEFSIDVDGKTFGAEEFGEVEWSEACDNLGASLVGIYRRSEVEVRLEHVALHDAPALLRTTTIYNRGQNEVRIGPVITESFELDWPESCKYLMNLKTPGEPNAETRFTEVGAVIRGDRGFLLAALSNAEIVLNSKDLAACSIRILSSEKLRSSQFVVPNVSILIAFEGDSNSSLIRDFPEIQRLLRLHERTKAKREREEE